MANLHNEFQAFHDKVALSPGKEGITKAITRCNSKANRKLLQGKTRGRGAKISRSRIFRNANHR